MLKRTFDILTSFIAICALAPVLLILLVIAAIDTGSTGLFFQERVGRHGATFEIFKLRTMHKNNGHISKVGAKLRRYKLDELPQIVNVLLGHMSIVGPRPDILGYYDQLTGEERKVLCLRPGLTSRAAIKYSDEESILKVRTDALEYNDTIIFPDKVRMNLQYYYNHNLKTDLRIIWETVVQVFSNHPSI